MKNRLVWIFLVTVCLAPKLSLAWGERGHHLICEVATRLVENKDLADFLKSRGHQAGHVCNIPDFFWRDLKEQDKAGEHSHFINPETLGYKVQNVPVSFKQIAVEKGKSTTELAIEFGSLWWRAEQFHNRAKIYSSRAKNAVPPTKDQEKDPKHPYNEAVFNLLVNLSLMGHFVGDASMPYHNTADYDGWESGRGGIHSFYESSCVTSMGMDLVAEIFEKAVLFNRFSPNDKGPEGSVIDRMKELSTIAVSEISKVEALDQIFSPSTKVPRVPAKRPSVEKAAASFRPLIVTQLARSALLLAQFWNEAYEAGGKANLKAYRSYRYPLTPEYIPLDYLGN